MLGSCKGDNRRMSDGNTRDILAGRAGVVSFRPGEKTQPA
ncbi:hypothetical protein BN130_1053 [Cronobacter malonaticus 507]|nr:hypothetical protein BN130_1053 [Cronobacter malonaticus 507]